MIFPHLGNDFLVVPEFLRCYICKHTKLYLWQPTDIFAVISIVIVFPDNWK